MPSGCDTDGAHEVLILVCQELRLVVWAHAETIVEHNMEDADYMWYGLMASRCVLASLLDVCS